MHPLIQVGLFILAALLGYKAIRQVPSLLHTPLMSGMNALSGVTVLGALAAVQTGSRVLGYIALFLAMINVIGGFIVTGRMLKMFKPRGNSHE